MAVHLGYERPVPLRLTSIGNKVQTLLLKVGSQLIRGVRHSQPHVVKMLHGSQVIVWAGVSYRHAVSVGHRDRTMRDGG